MKKKEKPDYLAAYCRNCKKKQPVQIDIMEPPKELRKILKDLHIISCGVCENVLNADRQINLFPVTEAWMNRKGWSKQSKKKKKKN
jgi:hypothetical protein